MVFLDESMIIYANIRFTNTLFSPFRRSANTLIFNIHASILERCGKLNCNYWTGSISGLPIIETIGNDITEYIATNIISITDGQLYTNKKLFLDSCRPSIDSALSVSRIGSNAQCRLIKVITVGLKNELTNYRIMEISTNSYYFNRLLSLNEMFFQDHLYISSINMICILIILYRNGTNFNRRIIILKLMYLLSYYLLLYYYYVFTIQSRYRVFNYYYLVSICLLFTLN